MSTTTYIVPRDAIDATQMFPFDVGTQLPFEASIGGVEKILLTSAVINNALVRLKLRADGVFEEPLEIEARVDSVFRTNDVRRTKNCYIGLRRQCASRAKP